MNTLAAGVLLGCASCRRSARQLDPGDLRPPWLGHAECEDGGPAAVLAVAGRQHELLVRRTASTPRCSRTARRARPARRRRRCPPPSPPATAGRTRGPSDAGTSAFSSGSSAIRLLWSYHSYSRVPRSTGASGFVQVIRRWKIGKRWNIPPGRVVPREDRVAHAEPAQAVARLQSARAAADDDDVVVARRERARSAAAIERAVRSRRASIRSMRSITCGHSSSSGLELGAGDHEAAEHRVRDDVGASAARRSAPRSRRRSRRVRAGARFAVELDRRLAFEDDVEVAAAEPAPQHPLAGGEDVLVVRVRDRLELRGRQVGEQGELDVRYGCIWEATVLTENTSC